VILNKPRLHIVAFDVPYPPDYGGAIDVFYKVKHLSEAGIAIYLHCPVYGGRERAKELEDLCDQVWYYPRYSGLKTISLRLPYMMYSRRNPEILRNLQSVEAPILFDGVNTSYYSVHPSLKNRFKILRNQNIEQDYFSKIATREKNLLRKLYYLLEARLLKKYESRLHHIQAFFTVARHDQEFFRNKYPEAIHEYIPSFQPYNEISSQPGKGSFCLYHGNLNLAENKEAALYLLTAVAPNISMPFIIAGRNPGHEIIKAAGKFAHCSVIANPSMAEMERLIGDAQIHLLPTFQDTGLKLKLLHALFYGRHVLVNKHMVHGTGLGDACHIATDATEFVRCIETLKDRSLDEQEIVKRNNILMAHYNNRQNALRIIRYLQQTPP
jgi:hypothetical protein